MNRFFQRHSTVPHAKCIDGNVTVAVVGRSPPIGRETRNRTERGRGLTSIIPGAGTGTSASSLFIIVTPVYLPLSALTSLTLKAIDGSNHVLQHLTTSYDNAHAVGARVRLQSLHLRYVVRRLQRYVRGAQTLSVVEIRLVLAAAVVCGQKQNDYHV